MRESLSKHSHVAVCVFVHMLMCFSGERKALLFDAKDTGNFLRREKGFLGFM